ncbi:hypothetical protein HanLR1_Chr00c1430g0806051 [Helianthus annuus]|nr:hypothetical protein HanLR1_Chr00c1430g0806051 [Helianthus annuus]
MKFMPKAPPRRDQKLVLPKPEKVEDTEVDDIKEQELLRRFNEASKRPKFKPEIKRNVLFSSSLALSQLYFPLSFGV